MYFERIYEPGLAQASYLIGCQRTGEALVVDPHRDTQCYLDAAARHGLTIRQITETHIHADFLSGSRELARSTGALMLLSGEGGPGWKYALDTGERAVAIREGDVIDVGNIRLDVLHTPGHTPEHLSFVVTDLPAAAGPWGMLTGDFVFVGDVGRPDLLEKAAGQAGTMESSARALFRSLQRFRGMPDHLQVWPGHGAGSACGKALGAVASSTVGYERVANWAVASDDEHDFVRTVLEGQPDAPLYFATMKRLNRDGVPRPIPSHDPPRTISTSLAEAVERKELVVDIRRAARHAEHRIPGTLNIPFAWPPTATFSTWAGSLLPYHRDMYLLSDDGVSIARAARALRLIGLDRVVGGFGPEALAAYARSGHRAEHVDSITPAQLPSEDALLVDVRSTDEWNAGHIPGAVHVPLMELDMRHTELAGGRDIIVHCQSGARSAMAASLLMMRGHRVKNLAGGYEAWRAFDSAALTSR